MQSTMVGTNGATTLFFRRLCAIYVVQMSTKCQPMLKAIVVLLYFLLPLFQIQQLLTKIYYNAIELTVCSKTNFQKSRKYKINRYKNLSNEVAGNYDVKKLFIEISTLRFYTNDMKPFIKFCKDPKTKNTD